MAKRRAIDPGDQWPDLAIPLPADGPGSQTYWQEEIEQAVKRKKKELPLWKTNKERYEGARPKLVGIQGPDVIAVNMDFINTEQKRAGMFFRTPEVQLETKLTGFDEITVNWQRVLNYVLGPQGVNASAAMDEILTDVMCPAGIGVVKIGYERRMANVDMPAQIDPVTQQPVADPLTGEVAMTSVPKVIWDRFFMERDSPASVLIPSGWLSTRYEAMPWIGREFSMDDLDASRNFKINREQLGADKAEITLAGDKDKEFVRSGSKGVEIWYKASLYDETVQNPELIRHVVLVSGKKSGGGKTTGVVIHEDSPDQTFDSSGAFLSGVKGFPLRILTLRPTSDNAYPLSDCSISRAQTDELSMGRSQMVLQRRRNLPMRWFDRNRVDKADIAKLERGEIQGLVPLDGNGDEMIGQVAPAQFPRENFTFNDYVQQDVNKQWAIGANQQGIQEDRANTATELSIIDRSTKDRQDKERNRLLEWFISVVEQLDALMQRYIQDDLILKILGPQDAQALQPWNRQAMPGIFAYAIKPNSSQRIDAAEERELYLRAYNLMANDPNVNRMELLKGLVAKFDLDPAKIITQPPPKPPDPPKVNLSFKGEDLLNPVVADVLRQLGIKVDPTLVAAHQLGQSLAGSLLPPNMIPPAGPQPHGGAAQGVPPISKHQADLTGQPSGRRPLA